MKCAQSSGNGSPIKRTTLHDLYEKQGQSPWYDNLCRPVTDLLPLIASGVRGVTSNPAVYFRFANTVRHLWLHCSYSTLLNFSFLVCRFFRKLYPLQMLTMINSGICTSTIYLPTSYCTLFGSICFGMQF